MDKVLTIARRELKSLFDHPTGYILVIIFVGVNDFLYFRQAYTFNSASLRPMLELLPWLFLFFIPAVTMRSLAEDARNGTVEVVLSHPLTERDYLLGKFLGQLVFVWMALGLTLLVPFVLSFGADLHAGVVFAQYVGAALMAAGLTAVGVWTSSLTKNQITAFIVAVMVMFLLVLVGLDPLLLGLSPVLSAVAARLGVLSHFRDIARGVIDLRDVIYFVTLVAIFLALAYQALMRRKLAVKGDARRRLQLGVTILVVGMVVVNLFGRNIGGRLDLTPGRAYTLSSATREMLGGLDDLLTLRLFVSSELPPEVALLRRDLDDLLRDYRSAGGDNVRLIVADPSKDSTLQAEVRSLGIPPVQFNVVGESQFTVRDGYMGLAIQYTDKTETIPFIRQTDDLEYRISSLVRRMTDTTRAVVGYYVDAAERQMPGVTFNSFRQVLSESYTVQNINLDADTIFPSTMTVAVFVGSPDSLTAGQARQFRDFVDRGGSIFAAASGMRLSEQQFAMGRPVALNDVLEPYGVSIGEDMVYDLLSNEMVATRSQFGQLLRQYPLWVRAVSTQASAVNQGLETAFLPWVSSVDFVGADSATVTPLFVTSQAGGVERNAVMLDPNRGFSQDSLRSITVAALVNPLAAEAEEGPRGRVAVVGTNQFLIDRFFDGNNANQAFALNAVDWLAQDEALMTIRSKNRAPPSLTFSSEAMAALAKYLNIAGIPIALVGLAVVRYMRRRRLIQLPYRGVAEEVIA